MRRAVPTVTGVLIGALLLSGCHGDGVRAGPDAANPACTALLGRLPASVLGRPARDDVDVEGAAEWGDPAIVLRCGVPALGPTTDHCIEIDDIDWVLTQSKPAFTFVTFGRTPATEVTVPASVGQTNAPSALVDLTAAVRPVPKNTQHCVGLGDT